MYSNAKRFNEILIAVHSQEKYRSLLGIILVRFIIHSCYPDMQKMIRQEEEEG